MKSHDHSQHDHNKIVSYLFQFKIVSDIDEKLKFIAEKGPEQGFFQPTSRHPAIGFLRTLINY